MALLRRSVLRAGAGGLASAAAIPWARAAAGPPLVPLTMATGEPGGDFALYGPAWGQQASRLAPIAVSYRASGGSAANILLVEQNAAQLGLTTLAVADQAWLGQAAWTGHVKLRGFRALFPIFEATWQVFAPIDGPVKQLSDLAGRRLGVGPAGGGSEMLTPALLAAVGITPRLAVAGLYLEQIDLLRRRRIDACAFLGVTPLPAIRADAAHGGFNLIGVSRAQEIAMRRATPGLVGSIIPRASLPRQTAAVATIGSETIAIGRADLPDALVEKLTEAALSRQADLLDAALIGAGRVGPKSDWIAGDDPIAIHPGAAKILRRHGFAAPSRLVRS
ncbi:TAXI family TRAP transporter solute-binding subunit [Acidiphilium sp.]|uniref:TAXI family TRAP transporter solute-binding subunit n=1 Tax=Acidiphilium sp. TaxID=527 RepID=UPI003D086230